MLKSILTTLPALALFAACAAPNKATVATAPEIAVHVPNVTFTPAVWETAGSEIIPTLKITTPPHTDPVIYSFHYAGDGNVTLPDPITLQPGETELQLKQAFTATAVDEAMQGMVSVVWSHPKTQSKVVGKWNVVQRPSILQALRVARADTLVDNDKWDATYAISVELDRTEEWVDQDVDLNRVVVFQASAGNEKTDPTLEVMTEVAIDEFTGIPRKVIPTGPHRLYVVCVKRPRIPARKRPFLQLKVRSGGDELERFIKLPF
ncbi:MAG: hypothetical protein P1V35_01070 [Planctomycetota bacterium]|nr:hypothetical protein [Planctomycetota bacterium]